MSVGVELEDSIRAVVKGKREERAENAGKLVEEASAGLIASKNVVGSLWSILIEERAPDAEKIIANPETASILAALAELALPENPALIAQQLAAMDAVLEIVRRASAPGQPTDRASKERQALVGCWRLVAALSTHPVTKYLIDRGLAELAKTALELRTDDEILLHCVTFCGNCAADHADLATVLCRFRIPRLLARLVCEPTAAAEVKEHAVVAANRISRSVSRKDQSLPNDFLPDAFADLVTNSTDYLIIAEGLWALHCLVAKGGPTLAAKLGLMPRVVAALEPHARAHRSNGSTTTDTLSLAQRVAALTLDDIRPSASS